MPSRRGGQSENTIRLRSVWHAASPPAALQSGGDPVQLLQAEAQRQPQPVARWLQQIAAGGTTLLSGGAQDAASAAFGGSDGPQALCQAVEPLSWGSVVRLGPQQRLGDLLHGPIGARYRGGGF